MEDNLSRLAQQQGAHVLLLAVSSTQTHSYMYPFITRHHRMAAACFWETPASISISSFFGSKQQPPGNRGALWMKRLHQHAFVFGVCWPLSDSSTFETAAVFNCHAESRPDAAVWVGVTTAVCMSHTGVLGPGRAMKHTRPGCPPPSSARPCVWADCCPVPADAAPHPLSLSTLPCWPA